MSGWTILFAALALVLVAIILVGSLRMRSLLRKLDVMLDGAIAGDVSPNRYDESQLSKLENKLLQILSTGKLQQEKLEVQQRTVHTLIGDISHQTKTPIANILLYSQLLQEREIQNEEEAELISQVALNAEKLNFLIQALVKTSRLESGVLTVTPKRQEIAALTQAACRQVQAAAAAKHIALTVEVPKAPIYARYDLKWCQEALFNLLDNAVKYTEVGGAVTLRVQAYEMFVRIDVADTGCGIAQADLARVFQRFWRSADNAPAEGVGIGLFLAREIVSQCGGYLKVASQKGQGTVFSMFLPAA